MASFDIGAKLRQERVGQGLAIDDIARDTRIAPRFLEAIEADDFAHLPGLIFTRNFVKQYALSLKLDPDPLLAELPKQDESTVKLPTAPARPRTSYRQDRSVHSVLSSLVWLMLAGGAGVAEYLHYSHSLRPSVNSADAPASAPSVSAPAPAVSTQPDPSVPAQVNTPAESHSAEPHAEEAVPAGAAAPAAPVAVTIEASEAAWVQVTADGKNAFTGTMQPNETKEIAASAQVKILTGNAGALTVSLNGKTLDSLGPIGQVRSIRLTAEGPQLPPKAPAPAPPDPL